MTKLFSVRFDVDTHRCVREGMPALSELGRRLDVSFTFFVNMGRAVSRLGLLARRGRADTAAKLSARRKLGWRGYLAAAGLNPRVGGTSGDVIVAARAAGHEIGLHGGRNHALWQRHARSWSEERLAAEIDAVLPALSGLLGGCVPAGFASPGWTTHPLLPAVLAPRGFAYLADLHGPAPEDGDGGGVGADDAAPPDMPNVADMPNVRTRLTGEPGGVAYLEHLRASGLDDEAVERRFESDLEAAGPLAVVYDHPYFAGVRDLHGVRRMVEIAVAHGYEVVPVQAVAEALRS